jgi:hypothetical protein
VTQTEYSDILDSPRPNVPFDNKSLSYKWDRDIDVLQKEREKGGTLSFKYWEKGALKVSLTYFGSYLVGKMFTLDFVKETRSKLVAED